jgi:hypothetical protein
MAVVGGSVETARDGMDPQVVWTKQLHKWLQLVADDCPPPRNEAEDANLQILPEYNATGTICGRTRVTLADTSTPGIVPQFAELCMFPHVPHDANLIVFQLCVNDPDEPHQLNTPDRRAVESMLRQALGMPSRPAVIMVCGFSPNGER